MNGGAAYLDGVMGEGEGERIINAINTAWNIYTNPIQSMIEGITSFMAVEEDGAGAGEAQQIPEIGNAEQAGPSRRRRRHQTPPAPEMGEFSVENDEDDNDDENDNDDDDDDDN